MFSFVKEQDAVAMSVFECGDYRTLTVMKRKTLCSLADITPPAGWKETTEESKLSSKHTKHLAFTTMAYLWWD